MLGRRLRGPDVGFLRNRSLLGSRLLDGRPGWALGWLDGRALRTARRRPRPLRCRGGQLCFVKRLARTATDWKPPLGFRGALVTARNGDAKGLDLKTGGVIPIVNLARFYALTNGITISSTNDRLVAAAEVGALDA